MEYFARALTALLSAAGGNRRAGDRRCCTALATGLAEGHVCIDTGEDEAVRAALPVLKNLRTVVGAPGDFTPLVLDGTRLYLGRYWHYERSVASAMRRLASPVSPVPTVKDLRRHLQHALPRRGNEERTGLRRSWCCRTESCRGIRGTGNRQDNDGLAGPRTQASPPGEGCAVHHPPCCADRKGRGQNA